jgi:hypothetical protein
VEENSGSASIVAQLKADNEHHNASKAQSMVVVNLRTRRLEN